MGDRLAVLSREMTKTHEEFIRGRLSEVRSIVSKRREIKGECTLLIHGKSKDDDAPMDIIMEELKKNLENSDTSLSRLVKILADQYDVPKSMIYNAAVKNKQK